MKFKLLTTGLIIGIMMGCSGTKQDTTVTSTSESKQASKSSVTEPNEFDSVSFPLESCGEKLPTDPKAYPVKYYPVFIDYSEGNLQSVKSKYCGDAFKKFRKTIGKDAIQVASFLSSERANKFQKFMIDKIGSGEVGEPTVIEAKRTTEAIDAKAGFNLSVAKAAQLTSEQTKQLISLRKNNSRGIDFKVIVPTYIPTGFQIDEFKAEEDSYGPTYLIRYCNSSNSCFEISSNCGGWGAGPTDYRNVEVSSPALGKVVLEYTDFDQYFNGPYIGLRDGPIVKGEQGYQFFSPEGRPSSYSVIPIQEAIKVVQSLKYLNP